jgi:hypothetical protein
MAGRERLPLQGEEAVSLEVAESPVVREDVEPVRGALERASGLVPPVSALAHVGPQHGRALVEGHRARAGEELVVGQVRHGVECRRRHLQLSLRVVVGEDHLRAEGRGGASEQRRRDAARRLPRRGEVSRPGAAAVRDVDALEEGGNHLAKFGQHQVGDGARLGEGVRAEAKQQRLVRLSGAVEADVRERGRR